MNERSKNLTKTGGIFAAGMVAFGYYGARKDLNDVTAVCPTLITKGTCDCVVDAYDAERGMVRGTVANMPALRHFVGESTETLGAVLTAAAMTCNAEMTNLNGVNQ